MTTSETTETPVRLYFESGAIHDMAYTTRYPVVGLDHDGRVVVDQSSEMGTRDGKPYLFGLTLCCDAFDKGYEDGVYCRACAGANEPFDVGDNWPEVADKFTGKTPWLPVPGHINDVDQHFCNTEGTLALAGQCPKGCDHAPHYTNDGHPGCADDEFMKRIGR